MKTNVSYRSFEAPLEGYEKVCKIEMPASLGDKWRRLARSEKSIFWMRWEDGTHAIVRFNIEADDEPTVKVESWVNLDGNNSFEDYKEEEYRAHRASRGQK